MSSTGRKHKPLLNPGQWMYLGILVGVLMLVVYGVIYQLAPLPGIWNDVITLTILVASAAVPAVIATLLVKQFQPGEPPRAIYEYFALGLWAWAGGELAWMMYYLLTGDVPIPSFSDTLWVAGMVFFAIAIQRQYRLLFAVSPRKERLVMAGVVVLVLLVTLVLNAVLYSTSQESEASYFANYLSVFYPVGDLAILIAGLHLGYLFGRGMWGRLWLGLLAFVISDSVYSYLEFSGLYANSVEAGNLLSLFVDTVYIAAYLLVALACYQMLLLLRYGPSMKLHDEVVHGQAGPGAL